MANIIVDPKPRMRVKSWEAPLTGDKVLGEGIDVKAMPDSHISCPMCAGFVFEAWKYGDAHRIEIGCCSCGWSARLLLPIDVDLSRMEDGKWTCFKHQRGENIIIKNGDSLCVGCRYCRSELILDLRSKANLVLVS